MSEVAEIKVDTIDISVVVNDNLVENTKDLVDNINDMVKEKMQENLEEVEKNFVQLFECFLTQDQTILVDKFTKFNVKLTPELQQYFLLLCKESPELFGTFEETLKRIISDDKINTKDIPDILLLVSKVYNIIKINKGIPTVDPYEVIKSLLHVALSVYLETHNSVNTNEHSLLLLDLLNIIDSSIDLIKMIPIVPKKWGCMLFKC